MSPATLPVPCYCKLRLAIVSFRGASWSHHLPRGLDWVWALMAATVLTASPPGPWLVAALTVHSNPSADTKTLYLEAQCCQHLSQQGPESEDFGPTHLSLKSYRPLWSAGL